MHSSAHGPDGDQARWAALVGRLRADADGLVTEFIDRVRAIPPYRRGVVPTERLVTDAHLTMQYLLRRIAGLEVPDWLLGTGESIGRDRARLGVPLNDLLTAVRLDFTVLWAALRELSEPDDDGLLVAHVQDVWNAVERYTARIQLSYQTEAALLARERLGERTMLLAALLSDDDPAPDDVARVAVALDVDPTADLLVAAATAEAGNLLRRAADRLAAGGRMVHVQSAGRHNLLLARWDGGTGAPVRAALAGVPCGVGPLAHGLAAVPRGARLAGEIVDVLPDLDGPTELSEAFLPLAAARLADTAGDLVESVLGGLARAPQRERERLLETVRAYAESGAVADVAARLYCHRNTVRGRLRRFTELTGHDVTVPAQAAAVLLALVRHR
ncbi:helix-turn-helix domain-containing protein, partial [Pseudonocardia acaciae]|uniref:helix-turn-helix domain-containing protein n=1 Tax=Pseudonocardia acaciae TaxID=551276 RepID=UPI00056A4470